jgi:osomolarity two-component system, sensor histidine kinase NIK1
MWVESEVSRGSKFFFTITSQISQSNLEVTLSKMQPFNKRTILFVDTLRDTTGVVQRIEELGLNPHVVHNPSEVADKDRCPHIDTIVVDDVKVVRVIYVVSAYFHWLICYVRLKLSVNMSICDISQLFF